jgi:hypothetical protein
MRNRRLAIAGFALVTAIGLAGCGPSQDKTATTAPAGAPAAEVAKQADPAAELAAAAAKLGEQSMKVRMEMAGGVSVSGVADPKAQTADMSMSTGTGSGGTDIKMLRVGNDMWMKFSGSLGTLAGNGKWMHLDIKEMANGAYGDPAATAKMIDATANVQRTGDHAFKGTLDLTKAQTVGKAAVKAMGDKANAVPFTARTDETGRLVELTVDMGGIAPGAGTMKSTYWDFGTPVTVKAPPAAQVEELPSQLKGILNG